MGAITSRRCRPIFTARATTSISISSHVLPALIRKAHEAREKGLADLVIWGSGSPRREFLHVDDCADALVHLLKVYSGKRARQRRLRRRPHHPRTRRNRRARGGLCRACRDGSDQAGRHAAKADERRAPCGARVAAENRVGGGHPRNLRVVLDSLGQFSTLKALNSRKSQRAPRVAPRIRRCCPKGSAAAMARIFIYAMNYSPEVAGVGRYAGEIGDYLAATGHEVAVLTTIPHYRSWKVSPPCRNGRCLRKTKGGARSSAARSSCASAWAGFGGSLRLCLLPCTAERPRSLWRSAPVG